MAVGLGEWASASVTEASRRFHVERGKTLDSALQSRYRRLGETVESDDTSQQFSGIRERIRELFSFGRPSTTIRGPEISPSPLGIFRDELVPRPMPAQERARGQPTFTLDEQVSPEQQVALAAPPTPEEVRAGLEASVARGQGIWDPLERFQTRFLDPFAASALQAVSRAGPLGGPAFGPREQIAPTRAERRPPLGEELINPLAVVFGDEEEHAKAQQVLEEAGLPAAMTARFLTDPSLLLPGVGVTRLRDLGRGIKAVTRLKGVARARAVTAIKKSETFQQVLRGIKEAPEAGGRVPTGMRLTNDIPGAGTVRRRLADIDEQLAKPRVSGRKALTEERAKLQAQQDIHEITTSARPAEEQLDYIIAELGELQIEGRRRGLAFRGRRDYRGFVPSKGVEGGARRGERIRPPSNAFPELSTSELSARERVFREFAENAKYESAPEPLVGRGRFTETGEVVTEPTFATEGEMAGVRAEQGQLPIGAGERPVETAGPLFERAPEPPPAAAPERPPIVEEGLPPPREPPPPGEPPREPPAAGAPPPPEPGAVPDTAMRELVGGEAVTPQLSRFDRAMNLLKRTVGLGVEEEATASTLMRQRRELKHTVETLSNRVAAGGGRLYRKAFKTDKLGRIETLPGKPTVQDVAARLPEYETLLTEEQRSALVWLRDELAPYEAALREQGVELGTRADIMEGGFYLPRGRADLEGVDMPMKVGTGGGKRGGRRGFERPAVFDRMTDGIDEGYRYAPFDEALGAYTADAGTRSLDSYTANLFKTATDDAGRLLGETPHARLLQQNPEIAARVEGLRKAVASLKRNVATLSRHHEEVLTRFASSPGPDLEELELALRELRQRPMRSVRGQTIAEARASLKGAEEQLRAVMPDWKKALDHARQMPRGEGQIGFYQLQGTSYPDVVASAANKYLRAEAPPSGSGTALTAAVGAVNNLLRGVRATADVSFTGIQGLLGLVHKPNSYRRAMQVAVRSMGDKDALGRFILEFDARAAKEGGLSSREWLKQGLQMGGVETEFMIGRGAGRPGQLIGGAPVIKQANRSFGYFGDTLRLDGAQGMYLASGTQDAKAIAEAANLMTGWSKGRFLGDVGNLVQFAPRFFQSQLDLLARALTDTGPAGAQARLAFLKLIGVGTLMTVAANESIGNKGFDYLTPFKKVNGKSRLNPNFMRIRFEGQDISLFGPWDSIVRGIVSAANGDLTYMTRSKSSPVVGTAWDAITGRTFMGEEFGVESFLRGLLPFSLAEIGREPPLETAISATGFKVTEMTAYERLAAAWEDERGKRNIPDIPFGETAQALKAAEQDPVLKSLVENFYASGAARGTPGSERAATAEASRSALEQSTGLVQAAQDIEAGLGGAEARYADAFDKYSEQAVGANQAIYGDLVREKGDSESQKLLDAYYAIEMIDPKYRDPETGEADRGAFFADKDKAFEALPQWLQTTMENDIKSVDPLVQQYEPDYRRAKEIRSEIYEMPKYQQLTVEEGETVDEFRTDVRQEMASIKREMKLRGMDPGAMTFARVAKHRVEVDDSLDVLARQAIIAERGDAPLTEERVDKALEHQDLLSRFLPWFLKSVLPIEVERHERLSEESFERINR